MGLDRRLGQLVLTQLPDAHRLSYTTPSGAAGLAECLLRVAFGSDPECRSEVPNSPAARLGSVCHRILELAGQGRLGAAGVSFRGTFEAAWAAEIAREEEHRRRSALEAHWPSPERWPNYARRKVATRRLAERIVESNEGPSRDGGPAGGVFQEVAQQAYNGQLRGRADVIRRGAVHEVEDYKTGALVEADGSGIKPQYRIQMLLYAALEYEATGEWPERATLIPLQGNPAVVEVAPAEALAVAQAAINDLGRYNRAVEDGADFGALADPSPAACAYCPYSIRCPAFWAAADETWREAGIVALAGEIKRRAESRLSTFSLSLDMAAGSVPQGEYLLYQLEAERFRALAEAPLGDECAAVWLIGDVEAKQLRATARTRVYVDVSQVA